MQDQLSDPRTDSTRPDPVLWTAPELQHPDLYPNLKIEATLTSDIYSLGSIILFVCCLWLLLLSSTPQSELQIYSGEIPWPNRSRVEDKIREFKNPPRPVWPASVPDDVWNLIERCWSPRQPRSRPSAYEVLSFFRDEPMYVAVVIFSLTPDSRSKFSAEYQCRAIRCSSVREEFAHQSSCRGANRRSIRGRGTLYQATPMVRYIRR